MSKRVIKFRAWDGGKMYYVADSYHIVFWHHPIRVNWNVYDDSGSRIVSSQYPKTALMEFTGIKDVNGKEIYEGDIVKNSCVVGSVIFDDGAYSILVTKQFTKSYDIGAKPPLYDFDNEVIGNIYEKKKKK